MPDSSKAPAPLPSVHAYVDYRKFLSEWLEAKQEAIPGYTLSRFARAARCSASHVRNVLSRERDLLPPFVDTFCRALRLSRDEAEFFTLLVRYQQALTVLERAHLFQQVAGAQQLRSANTLEGAQLSCLARLSHVAVYELSFVPEFRPDPVWIADVLNLTEMDAVEALNDLQAAKLLLPQEDGRLLAAYPFNISKPGLESPAIALFHERGLEAVQARLERSADDITCLSVVGPVSPDLMNRLREAVARFHHRIDGRMAHLQTEATKGAIEAPSSVCLLQIQLAPVSRAFKASTNNR